jgi:hypothetical protein
MESRFGCYGYQFNDHTLYKGYIAKDGQHPIVLFSNDKVPLAALFFKSKTSDTLIWQRSGPEAKSVEFQGMIVDDGQEFSFDMVNLTSSTIQFDIYAYKDGVPNIQRINEINVISPKQAIEVECDANIGKAFCLNARDETLAKDEKGLREEGGMKEAAAADKGPKGSYYEVLVFPIKDDGVLCKHFANTHWEATNMFIVEQHLEHMWYKPKKMVRSEMPKIESNIVDNPDGSSECIVTMHEFNHNARREVQFCMFDNVKLELVQVGYTHDAKLSGQREHVLKARDKAIRLLQEHQLLVTVKTNKPKRYRSMGGPRGGLVFGGSRSGGGGFYSTLSLGSSGRAASPAAAAALDSDPDFITYEELVDYDDDEIPEITDASHDGLIDTSMSAVTGHSDRHVNVKSRKIDIEFDYDLHSVKCTLGLSVQPRLQVYKDVYQDFVETLDELLASKIAKALEELVPDVKYIEETCCICLEARPDIVFCRCGHGCTHSKCDPEGKIRTCPLCRALVVGRVQ